MVATPASPDATADLGSNPDPTTVLAARPLVAAPALLGWSLETVLEGVRTAGTIVETEAYEGADDPASHAHHPVDGLRRTPRVASMYGRAGTLYVYRSYGIHWCANVVCGPEGVPGAVLIRAVDPTVGLETISARRPAIRRARELAGGPGRLTVALGITGDHDGLDLLADPPSEVRLRPPTTPVDPSDVLSGPRIGVSVATERPWRFGLRTATSLSKPF